MSRSAKNTHAAGPPNDCYIIQCCPGTHCFTCLLYFFTVVVLQSARFARMSWRNVTQLAEVTDESTGNIISYVIRVNLRKVARQQKVWSTTRVSDDSWVHFTGITRAYMVSYVTCNPGPASLSSNMCWSLNLKMINILSSLGWHLLSVFFFFSFTLSSPFYSSSWTLSLSFRMNSIRRALTEHIWWLE